ncbi:NPCBM/NEW2 domain-containing protein [Sedimentisphaera salicampi]|uniref:NPCBM/NEW2 domain-containing protein n=1 Tax=Sedimentisphaera salicampi TaxID=1941349 RepID=UPI000B9C2713|nr:NPCBM/NEW2 domain-containing protein [Sedimentisphaera salicampi]OXU14087.1 FecR protein [Sedimentisphaera salicampi]
MNKYLKSEIDQLLYLALEDKASPEQAERLNSLMAGSEEVMSYVADYYSLAARLKKSNAIALASLNSPEETNELFNVLEELAAQEQLAPKVEHCRECECRTKENPEKFKPVAGAQRVNKFMLVSTAASVAALLLIILYAQLLPAKQPVAKLKDSINAEWQGSRRNFETGDVFTNSAEPIILKEGYAEIEFDYGASVVIEAPSEFYCKSDNQIYIESGSLYARVPSEAVGFTVDTATSRIVDLGTEFGVQAVGDTQLHVHKGRTRLLAGEKNSRQTFSVVQGHAKRVVSSFGKVKDIELSRDMFVKQINSKTNLIRRGQDYVGMADLVSGGNGFGTGIEGVELNPVKAEFDAEILAKDRTSDNKFRSVESPFIDGVFVPNGTKSQIISSSGHLFKECPETMGNYYVGITEHLNLLDGRPIELDGVDYGKSDNSSIFMHANIGITFDLDALRSQLKGAEIESFSSEIGICNSSWQQCNADFWVLIDGQLKYSKTNVTTKGAVDSLNIKINPENRFLTIVTTDGGDPEVVYREGEPIYSIQSDWCIFAEPKIFLE